jgi:hypothetical protein
MQEKSTYTVKVSKDHGNDLCTATAYHPWQHLTVGSGLLLHAPLALPTKLASLQDEFAALDASLGPEGRSFMAEDGSWSSISLVERRLSANGGMPVTGQPTPVLAQMPTVEALLSGMPWMVLSCHLLRLPPHGKLPWHFENQAIHLAESRLLLPLLVPETAVTLVGAERVAYPAGTAWTGDFSFPHQVENPAETSRIVLIFDVRTSPELRGLLPPALAAAADLRHNLSSQARNLLLAWRARQAAA